MLKIFRLLTVSVIMPLASVMPGQTVSGVKTPDFAYPQTVSAQARKALPVALAADDGPGVVRSLLDNTLAQSSIARDKLPGCISEIDSVRALTSNHALQGILSALEAVIYNNVYQSEQWKYDRRTSPLFPIPADYTEWSGGQFRYRITSLIDSALTDSVALRAVPLAKYKNVITQDGNTAVYYPTLYDFVVARAIDIMSGWGDEYKGRVTKLYDSVIDNASRGSAQSVNAVIGRMAYLYSHTPQPRNGNSENDIRSSYLNLYRSYLGADGRPVTAYSGDILLGAPVYGTTYRRELYDAMESFLRFYPGYWRKDCIRQRLNQMSQGEVVIDAPKVTGPGREIEFTLTMDNVDKVNVEIYDVSSAPAVNDSYVFTTGMSGVSRVASIPVVVTGERVPFEVKRTVTYSFDRVGNYIAVPVVAGKTVKKQSFEKIHVTGLALCGTSFLDRTIWAVDANTGAPVDGATLSVNSTPYRTGSVTRRVGVTGADGALVLDSQTGAFVAEKGDDRFAMPMYMYSYNYERPDKWIMAASGYSSLPIYHPGDTVEWAAVCYEYKGGLHRPYSAMDLNAVLYDANSMPVDTLGVVTDRFGRASGSFILPKEGLTGSFRIDVNGQWGTVAFEVSDYKLPTFKVFAPRVEQDAPSKGDVTIRGKVETYAGFPLADAEVTLKLSVQDRPRWWYPSQSFEVSSLTARTGADGTYEVTVGSDVFAASPLPEGYYTAEVSVLSSTGETRTGSVSFGRKERYIIKADIPVDYDMSRGRMPVEIRVVNYEDFVVDKFVEMSLQTSDSTVVLSRKVQGRDSVDVSSLPQGLYRVVLACDGADDESRQLVLYNPSADKSPVSDRLLWSPVRNVSVGASDGKGQWLYAADCATHLLVTLWTADSVIDRRWVEAAEGFNRLPVTLPAGVDKATLTVIATGNYRMANETIEVKRAESEIGLKIVAESFRDRTVPGSDETWTFRIIDTRGEGREAAVIADMYNTALDALAVSTWQLNMRSGSSPWLRVNVQDLAGRSNYYMSVPVGNIGRLKCPDLLLPSFNTYGRPLITYLNGNVRLYGARMMKSAANVVTESATEEIMDCASVADLGAAPMLTGGVEQKAVKAEAAETEAEAGAGGEDPDVTSSDAFAYRDSNVPLAFFCPSLVTDKDGHLELKFTVPNANTTWGFRALAFTDSLLSATLSRDVIAAKDIMVQPNLPRFLRTGDKAVIKASVMNNTDRTQYVMTDIEIFNPVDGSNLCTLHRPDTIAARGNAVVVIDVAVPGEMAMVGYRVKSSTGSFADGEQALIPVLPATTPVIETIPFYMGPDQHDMKLRMPVMPEDGRVTLQFCENPSWYVVTALPGLLKNESSTAPDAARTIFSAAVASGLLRDNPAIADALKEWGEGDGSSAMLTSMLERNEELKTVLLNATPWMLDAANDTERMTRLSLLFDKKTIDKTMSENIALLKKLSCKGGGWSWCAGYPDASQWSTRSVLSLMGRLVQLGFMPDDASLKSMVKEALEWDTSEELEMYRKYPDGDYTAYVHLHDLFAGAGYGAPDGRIVNAATQHILSTWKNAPLAVKAVDAQVLYRHDYRSMAAEVLASIRQFGETTSEKGTWYPSLNDAWYGSMDKLGITALILETFDMIEPGCADVDNLRQWLILQKCAQNWGTSATATDVVAAILKTSHRWITAAKGTEVKIGGKKLTPESYERMTGEFECQIPVKNASGKDLTIRRQADTPSWGAVYCRYVNDMTDVKAAACPELSIEKSMPDTFAIGDRITVRLIIKADTDMDYVAIIDDRPACFEPVEQLPGTVYAEGVRFYRENRDSSTRIFIDRLPKGTYILTYDMWVNNAGSYTSGIATAQSQYAPRFTAHSSGSAVTAAE